MVKEKKMHRQKSIVNHTMNKVGGRKKIKKDTKLYHLSRKKVFRGWQWLHMMETVVHTGVEMQSRLVAFVGTGN